MKALEKAAQDRDRVPEKSVAQTSASTVVGAHSTPAPAASPASGLTLEPIEPVEPRIEPVMPTAYAKPGTSGPGTSPRSNPRNPDHARAAAVLSTKVAGGGAGAWISAYPVQFTAALAGIFAVGYGTYIYLQTAHPSLFIRKPPPAPVAATKPASDTPAPPSPSAVSGQGPGGRRYAIDTGTIGFQQQAGHGVAGGGIFFAVNAISVSVALCRGSCERTGR